MTEMVRVIVEDSEANGRSRWEEVEAYALLGLFAITRPWNPQTPERFVVTHLPTGRSMGRFFELATAQTYVAACHASSVKFPKLWKAKTHRAWISFAQEERQEVRRMKQLVTDLKGVAL